MTTTKIERLASIVQNLYSHILISGIQADAPYKASLSPEVQFALDEEGFYTWYAELLRAIFTLPGTGDIWSEEGAKQQIHALLVQLAEAKTDAVTSLDFMRITRNWIPRIEVEFSEQHCYVPIIGLSLDKPLTIGKVTFWPFDGKKQELEAQVHSSFFDELHSFHDCIASTIVKAEPRRSTEILRARAEDALNILRYVGALIWHGQPGRHIYVAGHQRRRVSDTVCIDDVGNITQIGDSVFTPVPFRIDDRILEYANFYGLAYLQSLLSQQAVSPIEQSLLIAIHWFGEATQELSPLFSFVKFYVPLEIVAKNDGERAKAFIPRRVSAILEPWSPEKQLKLESELGDIVDERNAVFHGGRPQKLSIEYLAWATRNFALGALHQLTHRIRSEKLSTKDDLFKWVNSQYTAPQ